MLSRYSESHKASRQKRSWQLQLCIVYCRLQGGDLARGSNSAGIAPSQQGAGSAACRGAMGSCRQLWQIVRRVHLPGLLQRYLHLAHSDHHLLLHHHHCPPHLLQHPNIQNIILVYEVWKVQRACCSGIVATESSEQQLSCSNSEFFCSFYLGSSGQEINWDGNNKQTNYTDLTFTFRHPTSRYLVNFWKHISYCHLYNL